MLDGFAVNELHISRGDGLIDFFQLAGAETGQGCLADRAAEDFQQFPVDWHVPVRLYFTGRYFTGDRVAVSRNTGGTIRGFRFHIEQELKDVSEKVLVGIIMGSQSDWETMKHAADTLESLGVAFETRVVSAHRTPDRMFEYAEQAAGRGLQVIIAGAGGAAHLPGMVAAKTVVPVLGVPVQSRALSGMDSLLSIAQMPAGIPVGTLAIGVAGATNAGLLAAAIIGNTDPVVRRLWKLSVSNVPRRSWPILTRARSDRVKQTSSMPAGGDSSHYAGSVSWVAVNWAA